MLRVVIMNDHAASLGAWLSALTPHDPPATVLHIDRHSDLAGPSQCDARTPRGDTATWARCTDRAGFQLAAAWLGLVHRVWWLKLDAMLTRTPSCLPARARILRTKSALWRRAARSALAHRRRGVRTVRTAWRAVRTATVWFGAAGPAPGAARQSGKRAS